MEANVTINKLNTRFSESIVETHSYRGGDTAVVRKEDLLEICTFLRRRQGTSLQFHDGSDRRGLPWQGAPF